MADAGEDVVERPVGRLGEPYAVGRDQRQVKGRREIAQRVVVGFFVAQQVALQLDADVAGPEDADDPIDEPADAVARRR